MNVLIDYSNIAPQFIPFYENGERVKVRFPDGMVKSGTVTMTTGWKPSFMLMLRSDSTGSSYLLTNEDEII